MHERKRGESEWWNNQNTKQQQTTRSKNIDMTVLGNPFNLNSHTIINIDRYFAGQFEGILLGKCSALTFSQLLAKENRSVHDSIFSGNGKHYPFNFILFLHTDFHCSDTLCSFNAVITKCDHQVCVNHIKGEERVFYICKYSPKIVHELINGWAACSSPSLHDRLSSISTFFFYSHLVRNLPILFRYIHKER